MKNVSLILTALFAFCGSISAQESHWGDFDYHAYPYNQPFVAYIQLDGAFIDWDYDSQNIEVAAFVDDECRGHALMHTEDILPFPVLELPVYYDGEGNEDVTFVLYDHSTGLEYGSCSVSFANEESSVLTGVEHVEAYFGWPGDSDQCFVLNFTDPQFGGLELADDGTDNSAIISDNLDTSLAVKLTGRTLYKDGYWNTICLPFDVWIADSPLEGATVKELADATMSGNTVHLTFADSDGWINAGVPYIIRWEEESGDDIVDPVFTGAWFYGLEEDWRTVTMADGNVKFIGYYDALQLDPNNDTDDFEAADVPYIYYMTSRNTLKHTGVARTLKAFRAYFQFSEAAKGRQVLLDFGAGATAIASIENGQLDIENQGAWHTLDGLQLSTQPRSKGVYIHGKRKVVVR